jgi:hypothetical protein
MGAKHCKVKENRAKQGRLGEENIAVVTRILNASTTKARFKLGVKKLGAKFQHFWLVVWPQGLQIGFPDSMVSFFSVLGPIQGHNKVQHLLVTWGRFFSISALTPSVKKPFGLISTFAPIGMLDLS